MSEVVLLSSIGKWIEFTLISAQFAAPGQWRGMYDNNGSITPNTLNNVRIRDCNASLTDLMGPMYLQFGFFDDVTPVSIKQITLLNKTFGFHSISMAGAYRHFFTDGETNVYDLLGTVLGVPIKVYVELNEL